VGSDQNDSRITGCPEFVPGQKSRSGKSPTSRSTCLVFLGAEPIAGLRIRSVFELTFSTFGAVSKGAGQEHSIYLILRSIFVQQRTVSTEVF
jgi:hypothetical protein